MKTWYQCIVNGICFGFSISRSGVIQDWPNNVKPWMNGKRADHIRNWFKEEGAKVYKIAEQIIS